MDGNTTNDLTDSMGQDLSLEGNLYSVSNNIGRSYTVLDDPEEAGNT